MVLLLPSLSSQACPETAMQAKSWQRWHGAHCESLWQWPGQAPGSRDEQKHNCGREEEDAQRYCAFYEGA